MDYANATSHIHCFFKTNHKTVPNAAAVFFNSYSNIMWMMPRL